MDKEQPKVVLVELLRDLKCQEEVARPSKEQLPKAIKSQEEVVRLRKQLQLGARPGKEQMLTTLQPQEEWRTPPYAATPMTPRCT